MFLAADIFYLGSVYNSAELLWVRGNFMKAWKLPLSSAIFAISVGAYAVEPVGIVLDSGITLLPSVELSVSDDDNVYLQPEASQEGSTITRLKPALGVEADLGQTKVRLGYMAEKGTYSSDDNDNYTDQTIAAGADFEMTSRHQLNLNAILKDAHDARGASTATLQGAGALSTDPDEYDETTMSADFIYGSESAFLNLITGLNRYEKEYGNNFSDGTRDRDHVKTTLSARLAFDVSSATDILVDVSNTNIEYNNDSAIADSREGSLVKALIGASYDLSGKLTGSAKVGVSQRSFDESDVDSDSALSWELNLAWNPRTYSTVTLFTAQTANETSGPGNYIDSNYSMASWEHEFSEYFSLTADVSLANDVYYNDTADREDETLSYGLTGTYSPTKALDVSASVKQADRDSTVTGLDYEQQVITVGVALAI